MAKIKINGDSSGYVEIAAPNAAHNNTLELGPGTKILTDKNTHTSSIGIGTDNPTETLTLNHANGASIGLEYSGTENGTINVNSAAMYVRAGTGKDLILGSNGTEKLRIDSDGRLLANGAAATNAWTGGDDLIIGNTDSGTRTGITLVSHSGSDGGIYWSDGTGASVYRGQLAYNHASDTMAFYTAASSKLSIDTNGHMRLSSGDLRVGDNTDSNAGTQTISVGSVSSGSGGIGIFANPTNGNSFVQFGDGTSSADQYRGYMNYRHADDSLRFGTANTDRLLIASAGGHKIVCNESWHAANLSECNTNKLALNINQTRQGQTKGIAIGCVGGGSGSTGIQAYDTSDNSANTLELNPFGGKLLYGDTASDLSSDHSTMFIGSKHAFQHDGNTGTYLSVILGSADGTVDLEADARSGGYPDLRFITTNDEQLRVLAAGHIWKKSDGSLWHGTSDINDFSNASRATYNNVSIRAGRHNAGTSPTNDNSAIKIYPAGVRDTTTGNLTGGIAWQHLDPDNGSWDTNYGPGAQIWMGAALHDTPGQERDRFNLWMNSQTAGNSNPNNLAIEAYPNGMVRHPKVPAFHSTGGTALSNNTYVTIVGSNAVVNNGNCYSTSNGRFTAPIDGIYQFSFWGLLYPHSSGVVNIYYSKNGSQWANMIQGGADSSNHTSRSGTVIMSMNANDYADLRINRGSNTGINAYGSQWNMCGFLVG